MQQAVEYALANYPAVRAALESYAGARAGTGLAATNYLPRVDAVWQGNRGTRNIVLGVLLPQFPNILTGTQGTVLTPSNRSFWASGGGLLFSWEPFDFGYRRSELAAAQSTATRTAAQVTLTRLGVAAAAADASLADAELAAARTQLILAQENLEIARAALGELLGISGTQVAVVTGPFLQLPPENGWTAMPLAIHPAAVVEQRRIDEEDARINVIKHSYYPHFDLEALTSARGSGEDSKGVVAPGFNGLGADVHNWAAGLTVSLPLLDFPSVHERKKIELANRRREQALYDQTLRTLSGQLERSRATLDGARRVAEAQRLLVQAEIDDSLARLSIWRALADLAAAQGDVTPFLNTASSVTTGAP